jgi:Raf kinase inhibitor-like YbhB/YbcL family protein
MIIAAAFVLASATFKPNARMPLTTVYKECGGSNISPELHWRGAPARTKSFALIVHDPDAPAPGGWYHWVAYNLPATTEKMPPGMKLADSQLGETSFTENRYGGPCPPPGKPHHYNFTLYALDVATIVGDHLTGPELEKQIAGHTLAKATLTGLYGR